MDILFITHNRLGDAVLSTGLLGHLIDRFPEARLTVACGPVPAPLLALAPNVEELLVMEKRPLAGHWWRLWRSVAGRRWDLVVDLRGSAIAWLLRAGERRVLRPDGDRQHRVRHLAGVLDLTPPPVPRLWLRPEHAVAAAELIPEGPPVLAIGPTANWGGKQWPADRFAELARRLTHGGGIMAGARIAVFGAPDERPAAAATLAGLPAERRLDLLGRVDLPTLHGCLGRCQFFVGNDSGLMHMAAAAGIPTLGLFGPSREELYAPWGDRAAAVRTDLGFDDIRHDPAYDYRRQDCWMMTLSVDKAEQAAVALHRRLHGGGAGARP